MNRQERDFKRGNKKLTSGREGGKKYILGKRRFLKNRNSTGWRFLEEDGPYVKGKRLGGGRRSIKE